MQYNLVLSHHHVQCRSHALPPPVCTGRRKCWACARLWQSPAGISRQEVAAKRRFPSIQVFSHHQQQSSFRHKTSGGVPEQLSLARPQTHGPTSITSTQFLQSVLSEDRSKLLPVAATLLSIAAVACWSGPAYADGSAQAVEQVAQQLTANAPAQLSMYTPGFTLKQPVQATHQHM